MVGVAPPLPLRPSRVAHAQPPGPGLPEHAPSVHTSSAPSTAGMSRRARVGAAFCDAAFCDAAFCDVSGVVTAHGPCAQPWSALLISSPGWTGPEQTRQVVA